MLYVLKERLLSWMVIKEVEEFDTEYDITFLIYGEEVKGKLSKYSDSDVWNTAVDTTIFLAMADFEMKHRNLKCVKYWIEKIFNLK